MKTIWQYRLKITGAQEVKMPADAQILCVNMQYGSLYLWVIVDPDEPQNENRKIHIIGTGQEIKEEPLIYIGTALDTDGGFEWHVFEDKS